MSGGHEPNPVTLRLRITDGRLAADLRGPQWCRLITPDERAAVIADSGPDPIRTDAVLLPMYPEQPDLEGAIQRLTGFLEQYWGGPTTYSEERGHPRLRMRHAPFKVNPDARDRWLKHMRAAVDTLELSPLHDATLWAYLDRAAQAMVNTLDD